MNLLSCFEFGSIKQFRFESFEKVLVTALSQHFPFLPIHSSSFKDFKGLQFV